MYGRLERGRAGGVSQMTYISHLGSRQLRLTFKVRGAFNHSKADNRSYHLKSDAVSTIDSLRTLKNRCYRQDQTSWNSTCTTNRKVSTREKRAEEESTEKESTTTTIFNQGITTNKDKHSSRVRRTSILARKTSS